MARNTVKIKRYVDNQEEFAAAGTIAPGMLVELQSSGRVRAHSVVGGRAQPRMFAVEDELQGKGLADNYSTGDRVQVAVCVPGEMVYALLKDGEKVVIGDALESAGNGYLRKFTSGSVVAIAREALDLSASAAEPNCRLIVQIA